MWERVYELRSLLVFPVAFISLWIGLLFVRKLIWNRLEKVLNRTRLNLDASLLKAMERPIRYLILFGSLSVSLQWAPAVVAHHPVAHALCKIGIVSVLAWIADRAFMVFLFHSDLLRGLSTSLKNLLKVVLRLGIYSIVVLISLESFGVSITPLLASLGVGSLAVALALQDTLSNLFSGFYLALDRPIRLDDQIRLEDGTEGKVVNIGWRSTRIQLGSGSTVILPNSKLSSSRITNFEIPTPELTFSVAFYVGVESDLENVQRVALEVARECQKVVSGAVTTFEPVFQYQAISEYGIGASVVLKSCKLADLARLRHEFIKRVIPKLKGEGVRLPLSRVLKSTEI